LVELNSTKKHLNKEKAINKTNSILIIGKGATEYKNKEVLIAENLSMVEYCYGEESELTLAYKEAKEIGAENIFLCNCYLFTDYISVLNNISSDEFLFITPLFNFSDTYITKNNNKVYLCELYSNIIGNKLTQLIFTDTHASLYEDIEHYLDDMNDKFETFKLYANYTFEFGDNFCFILNNLKNYKFANVALASVLSLCDLKYYPQKNLGDVVFDITENDVYGQEIVYFAYNLLTNTTIENMFNFRNELGPEKFIPIHFIIQLIKRQIDFSEFSGKLLTPYLRIQLENSINDNMEKFVGKLIEYYRILKIDYVISEDHAVIINIYLSIKPYNSIEEITISMEV
jgi:hypothetical protein